MNVQTIIWVIIGVVAAAEFLRLYYRVHMLESNMDKLLSIIERIVKKTA